jgi:L-arabinose transport system substrate-binding protein
VGAFLRALRGTTALSLAALLAVVACGGGTPSTGQGAQPVKLALMTKDGSQPFWSTLAGGAKGYAASHSINLTVQDLQENGDTAITYVDTVIASGVKGIVITVPTVAIGPTVIAKAKAAKVKMLALFDSIKDSSGAVNPFFGLDDKAYGEAAGKEIARQYQALGWGSNSALVVRYASIEDNTIPACVDRQNSAVSAFKQAVPTFTDDQVIHVTYKNDEQTAIDGMAATITSHPKVTNWLMSSCNDNGVAGAVRALQNAGVPANRGIGVGQGSDQACAEFSKATPDTYMGSTYIDSAGAGAQVLGILNDSVVNNTPLPALTTLAPKLVTRDNYKTLLGC